MSPNKWVVLPIEYEDQSDIPEGLEDVIGKNMQDGILFCRPDDIMLVVPFKGGCCDIQLRGADRPITLNCDAKTLFHSIENADNTMQLFYTDRKELPANKLEDIRVTRPNTSPKGSG